MSHVTTDKVTTFDDETTNENAPLSDSVTSHNLLSCSISTCETGESFHDVILPQSLILISSGSCVCRICHTNTSKESLISPCRCKGTLAYVHFSCLERWLNQSSRNHCELCRYHFNAVETPRYRLSESLRIWISHPRNRRHVQSDLLIFSLLTVVTMGLVSVCVRGMHYFIIEGRRIGMSRLWTKGAISFFLAIIVLGYTTTVYLIAKDQVSPWYRWWKSTVNIRLVIDQPHETQRPLTVLRNFDDQQPFTNNSIGRFNAEAETRESPTSTDLTLVSSTSQISQGQRTTFQESQEKPASEK